MPIPDFQTLMLPVLRQSKNGEIRISQVIDNLAKEFSLTDSERAQLLPSGRQTTFANRVHWAKSYLAKAALVVMTKKAYFNITERGKKVLESSPPKITINFLKQFPEFIEFQNKSNDTGPNYDFDSSTNAKLTPDETMRGAARELENSLAQDLLQRVMDGTPAFFESMVVRLLFAMGYGGSIQALETALVGKSGDGGVDGVINQDALGLDRIYMQAKRYAPNNSVGAADIRDFFGSLDRFKANKGLFVTTSSFSGNAKETANLLSKPIVLVDGTKLAKLLIQNDVGCRTIETLSIKQVDEDFFDT